MYHEVYVMQIFVTCYQPVSQEVLHTYLEIDNHHNGMSIDHKKFISLTSEWKTITQTGDNYHKIFEERFQVVTLVESTF